MSNRFGSALQLQIFGQSHAPAIGMTLDGFPAGFTPDMDALAAFLARRAPGQGPYATARKEADTPEFLSGLVNGTTCGAPLCAIIRNTNARPQDYAALTAPRPSHADFTARAKLGESADLSGGGAFSGRLTAPLCIAGGLCLQYLKTMGIEVFSHIARIGNVEDDAFDPISPRRPAGYTLRDGTWAEMLTQIAAAKAEGDSLGGVIACAVTGLPAGVGEPMFGGMENRLAQILFAIPAVKGLEFGSGFACGQMRGSAHNDPFYQDETGTVRTRTNHAGGILGGITTGMPLIFRFAVKPTPSIAQPQESVSYGGGAATLKIHGRHDPCIVPRALPCGEAAAAIAVLDAILEGKQWT